MISIYLFCFTQFNKSNKKTKTKTKPVDLLSSQEELKA